MSDQITTEERDRLIDLHARGLIDTHPDQCVCIFPKASWFDGFRCASCGKSLDRCRHCLTILTEHNKGKYKHYCDVCEVLAE